MAEPGDQRDVGTRELSDVGDVGAKDFKMGASVLGFIALLSIILEIVS